LSATWNSRAHPGHLDNTVESGEHLGRYKWNDEILNELGGDFLFAQVDFHPSSKKAISADSIRAQYADLRRLLYETALKYGATVSFSCKVVKVDPHDVKVVVSSGDTISCDVIIGADGTDGLTRQLMLSPALEEKKEDVALTKMYR
jgi:salicylate hydroxylase